MARIVAVGVALVLATGVGCAGHASDAAGDSQTSQGVVNMSEEVTERDCAMAEQLGAPDDVIASLKEGTWPSVTSQENVRYAEAAEDHLSERYGEEFHATEVTLARGALSEADSVTCMVGSGPFEGKTCVCTFFPNGAPQSGDAEWADSYPYVRLHDEYESAVEEAVASAFADVPRGTWTCSVGMDDRAYPEVANDVHNQGQKVTLAPDAPLAEAGPYLGGHVWAYLSPESAMSEEEYERRINAMVASLEELGLNVHWEAYKVTMPLGDAGFTGEWAQDAVQTGQYTWQLTGDLSGVR